MKKEPKNDWETNRDFSKRPKSGGDFCRGCDRTIVRDGAKCSICGWINGKKARRFKKNNLKGWNLL